MFRCMQVFLYFLQLLYARSEMIDLLITSDVARYCEFRTITQILTESKDKSLQVKCVYEMNPPSFCKIYFLGILYFVYCLYECITYICSQIVIWCTDRVHIGFIFAHTQSMLLCPYTKICQRIRT